MQDHATLPRATDRPSQEARWGEFFPELTSTAEVTAFLERTSTAALLRRSDQPEPVVPHAEGATFARACEVQTSVIGVVGHVVALTHEDDLRDSVAAAGHHADGDAVLAGLVIRLASTIGQQVTQPLALELHRMREAGQLDGADPQERYESFRSWMASADGFTSLFTRYPRLGSDVGSTARRFVANVREAMSDYARERSTLESTFGISPGARLVEVRPGAGDQHRGGRSVCILGHDDDTVIVYKPRDARIDRAFAAVLGWSNQRFGTQYPLCEYLDRDRYCFVEHVPVADVDDASLLSYYRCAGGLLAILHTLNGSDIHFENLRTNAGRPVVVDLETLMHPAPLHDESLASRYCPTDALAALGGSVTRTGLLPRTMRATDGSASMDIGGIGYAAGARSPHRVQSVVDDHTDRMRVSLDYVTLDRSADVPTMAAHATADELIPAFEDGFRQQYEALLGARNEYLDLVRAQFSGQRVRYLNNPTMFYAQLLQMSCHPDLSHDLRSREVLLHRVALPHRDLDPRLARSEVEDLLDRDVPYLTVASEDTELHGSRDEPLGVDVGEPPLDSVVRKIEAMGAVDLDRQVRIIATSMLDKRAVDPVATGITFGAGPLLGSRADYLSTAGEISDFLLGSMFRGDDDVPSDWIGAVAAEVGDAEGWQPGTLGLDAYAGRSGIAEAFAAMARLTGRADLADAARSVALPLARALEPGHPLQEALTLSSGAFTGQSGAIRSVLRIGRDLDDDDLVDAAFAAVETVETVIADLEHHDLVVGTAGSLAVALATWHHARDDDDVRRCRDLVEAAVRRLDEVRETAHVAGFRSRAAHSGYAHGAAGFYPWLFAASERLGDTGTGRLARSCAERFLEHERELYDDDLGDWWRDATRERRSYGWCHGAPGILLARLLTVRERPDLVDEHAADIERAVHLTRERGNGNNPTYCHGDLGNLEILSLAAETTGDDALARDVDATFAGLHRDHLTGMLSDLRSRHALSNGLLIGLAGTVLGLARRAAPGQVEAVLW